MKKTFVIFKNKHPDKKLKLNISKDSDWNFIKEYPIKLYKNEQRSKIKAP